MKKKIIVGIVVVCLICIIARVFISRPVDVVPEQLDFVSVAKEASKTQGKLAVMRIYGTTTVYRENKSAVKGAARVGYVHDGSADIVVDLTKAEFQYQEVLGLTNLVIKVPYPELDRTTVGIDPSKLKRVKSIPRSKVRRQEVFTALEDECSRVITQKQYETFSSFDVIEDAKMQARRVLINFYRKCVDDKIAVDVEFTGEYVPYSPNPDVKPAAVGL